MSDGDQCVRALAEYCTYSWSPDRIAATASAAGTMRTVEV
jgi:hypothetical protein